MFNILDSADVLLLELGRLQINIMLFNKLSDLKPKM